MWISVASEPDDDGKGECHCVSAVSDLDCWQIAEDSDALRMVQILIDHEEKEPKMSHKDLVSTIQSEISMCQKTKSDVHFRFAEEGLMEDLVWDYGFLELRDCRQNCEEDATPVDSGHESDEMDTDEKAGAKEREIETCGDEMDMTASGSTEGSGVGLEFVMGNMRLS